MAGYQQYAIFGANGPLSKAIHYAIENIHNPYEGYNNYYAYLTALYSGKADNMCRLLQEYSLGWRVFRPNGGYFTMVDITNAIVHMPIRYFYHDITSEYVQKNGDKKLKKFDDWLLLEKPDKTPDYAFCIWMTEVIGITPIPCFGFFLQDKGQEVQKWKNINMIRFAQCKNEETMKEAEVKLAKYYNNFIAF